MLKKNLLPMGILMILWVACSKKYNPSKTPFAIYHPIPEDSVRKLEKGVTTPAQVVKLFGNPAKNSISDKGERYVYGYLGDTLTVNFDGSNTVNSFLYRPEIFTPVSGNTDNTNKRISENKIKKIEIYNSSKFTLEKWFGPANKKETGTNRNRYTYKRRNGTLIVYTLANFEERVLSYHFEPKD